MTEFLGFIKINQTWTNFKNTVSSKNLMIQYNDTGTEYEIFALDGQIVYVCTIFEGPVPQSSLVGQSDNDAYKSDFQANYMPSSNQAIIPKNSDGKQISMSEKVDYSKITFYSHDWTNPTTWYTTSQRIVNETPTNSGDNTTYYLANKYVIDTYHGNLTGEDYLKDANGYSYRVSVTVDGYNKIEQDPHYGTGGDFTINYADGYVIFNYALNPTDTVLVTYHKMVDSSFYIKPLPGTKLKIMSAEIQFSTDIIINDSAFFQPYGYVDYFAPQLMPGIPSGTLIPLGNPVVYKTISDFNNDANKSYPAYPALGGTGWRGIDTPTVVFVWDYTASTPIRADYGMEVKIKLQHDEPFGGTYGTATFYCIYENL